jgi:hypothetical protein
MDEPAYNSNGQPPRRERLDVSLVRATPTLLRLAAGAYVRGAQWGIATSVRVGGRMVRAAAAGESPAELVQDATSDVRDYARHLLGLADGSDPRETEQAPEPAHHVTLRERGAELLAQSADVGYEEHTHPAFDHVLDDLAPDEARILRMLHGAGAQPAVDVRESKPLGIAAQLVSEGLSMIGTQAGVRFLERVPAYLSNLERLGLIWFSREPLEDPLRYQVLEAQPEVLGALRRAGRAKTVRRSIKLTPFGEDFCATCLPTDTAEIDALAAPPLTPG